jgi:alkaline phosphatase D
MRRKLPLAFGFLLFLFLAYLYGQAIQSGSQAEPPPATEAKSELTVAFGSCNRQTAPQDYWSTIAGHEPDAWLWLGDNIYADTDDPEQMRADYATQKSAPEYAAFRQVVPTIYGIWDDHDYGKNDAGREWPMREQAQTLMLDFLDVPADHPARTHGSTYQSYRIGPVKVILLDTRYFRDELLKSRVPGQRYAANPDGDILGEQQWEWLEAELRDSDAEAHLIASSIQVLHTDHGYEKWANFPAARNRLLQLLATTRPALPLLLSGDRHLAEFAVDRVDDFRIVEMTSSGLTHAYDDANEVNTKRVGPLVTERNYGMLHYVRTARGLRLLAEIRALDDDAAVSSLALPLATANINELRRVVHQNEAMSRTLKPCPQSPNCVSTQTDQEKKRRDPIAFSGTAEEARARIKKVVSAMPRTTLVEEDGNYLHYTFKTWPIPYIDDVEFVVDPEEQVIHYRSASRVGHSDLGVNSRRMAKVVSAFTAG